MPGITEKILTITPRLLLFVKRFDKIIFLQSGNLAGIDMMIENILDEFSCGIQPERLRRTCFGKERQTAQRDHPGTLRIFTGNMRYRIFFIEGMLISTEFPIADSEKYPLELFFAFFLPGRMSQKYAGGKQAFTVEQVAKIGRGGFLLPDWAAIGTESKGQPPPGSKPAGFQLFGNSAQHVTRALRQTIIAIVPIPGRVTGKTFQTASLNPGINAILATVIFIRRAKITLSDNIKLTVDERIIKVCNACQQLAE